MIIFRNSGVADRYGLEGQVLGMFYPCSIFVYINPHVKGGRTNRPYFFPMIHTNGSNEPHVVCESQFGRVCSRKYIDNSF
jgi:hypothetical protein